MTTPTTLKAAKEQGYVPLKPEHYGGTVLVLRGRSFAKGAKTALSATAWWKQGFRVVSGSVPHATVSGLVGHAARRTWDVFREDQVEPRDVRGPVAPATEIDLLLSLWAINRHAKRLRDRASDWWCASTDDGFVGYDPQFARKKAGECAEQKRRLYALKEQAIHYLIGLGRLRLKGHHRFGERWAEVLEGTDDNGHTLRFHRPCEAPEEIDAEDLVGIDSKTKKKGEPRLRDAILTVEAFLQGKPKVAVYQWAAPVRVRSWEVQEDFDEQEWS